MTHDEIAEHIIKREGLTFALACAAGKNQENVKLARQLLKEAIVKALADKAQNATLPEPPK